MTRDEIRNMAHDYFDGLLPIEEKETIDSYLEEFEDVAQEFDLLRKMLNKAESLPLGIKTPSTALGKISDELLSQSLEKIESEKQRKLKELTENTESVGSKRKKIEYTQIEKPKSIQTSSETGSPKVNITKASLILLLTLIIIIGGYFLYDYFNTNLPWQIKLNYGQYNISPASANSLIDIEQTLNTLDSTKVSINIPNAGRVDVGSLSSVKVLKGKDSENILSLISGRVDAICKMDDPRLIIKTPQAELKIMTGNLSAKIDDEGNLNLRTGNGIINIITSSEELILIQDHMCRVLGNGTIGLPYHIESDSNLVSLVNKISFDNPSIADFGKVLLIATPLDGMTLLQLLKEAKNPNDRIPIFQKLNEFYPVVPGITQEGIIKLDKKMLELWHKEIEWQI